MSLSNIVVVLDDGYDNYDTERAILVRVGALVSLRPCRGEAARVREAVRDADALLVRESPIDAAAIDAMTRSRVIVRYGIGVDNIDLEAARARRIYVANVPDYGTEDVSDHAVALLLAVARRIVTRDSAVRAGAWFTGTREKVYRPAGRTLGLLGYGRIARTVERKMRGLGIARVLVHDPYADLPSAVEAADPDRLCREADYISLHAPLTPQTRHVLDAKRIALMKPTAIVVNTGRGGLVDEVALAEALRTRRIFGAGIDVFEQEPPGAAHPLFGLENVVVSDHAGWYSEESVADLQRKAAEEVARVLAGEPPLHWLNRW